MLYVCVFEPIIKDLNAYTDILFKKTFIWKYGL